MMLTVEVIRASDGKIFQKRFRSYNSLMKWMRKRYDRWIVNFRPLLSKADVQLIIYDDFVE